MDFKDILKLHIKTYPKLTLIDLYKMIYQSEFGGGHIILDVDKHLNFLSKELEEAKMLPFKGVEIIDHNLYRLYLDGLYGHMDPFTIQKMILVSANNRSKSHASLLTKLEILKSFYDHEEIENLIKHIKDNRYPIYSHSVIYKTSYHPHYRIIHKDYAFYLKVFMRIDTLLKKQSSIVIAIDGMTTSGKSYLASLISTIYDANIIHADDFFLQAHQKTDERLNEIGGNLDYERLYDEVLSHLNDEIIHYRPYDCKIKDFKETVELHQKKITIIEGSYTLRRDFRKYYDLMIYLSINHDVQLKRVKKRNEHMIKQFETLWIPKEMSYFEKESIEKFADLSFDTSLLFDVHDMNI